MDEMGEKLTWHEQKMKGDDIIITIFFFTMIIILLMNENELVESYYNIHAYMMYSVKVSFSDDFWCMAFNSLI